MNRQIKSRVGMSGFLFALLVTLAGGAVAGITGSKHDLSTSGGGTIKSTDQTEICVFCHTPHDAIKNNNIPLWNHTLSTTANYGVYTSPTFDATDSADLGGVTATNAAVSNLCLSCHDGTVAVNSLNNASNANPTTTMATTLITGSANLGTGVDALKNDHPVNFTYNPGTGAGLDAGLTPTASLVGVKLYSNKVQCASCHDPHTSADPSGKAFLRVTMAGSSMCLKCHVK